MGSKRRSSGKNSKQPKAARQLTPEEAFAMVASFLASAGFEEIEGGHLRVRGWDYMQPDPQYSDDFRSRLCAGGLTGMAMATAFMRWLGGPWEVEDGMFKCNGRTLPCELFATQSLVSHTIMPRVALPGGELPEVADGKEVTVTDEITALSLGLAYMGGDPGSALYWARVEEDLLGYFLIDCREVGLQATPIQFAHGIATLCSKLVLKEHLTGLRAAIGHHGLDHKETECDGGFIIEVGNGDVVFKLCKAGMLREILVLAPGGRGTEQGRVLVAAPPPPAPEPVDRALVPATVSGNPPRRFTLPNPISRPAER